jgi:hypothetical protein
MRDVCLGSQAGDLCVPLLRLSLLQLELVQEVLATGATVLTEPQVGGKEQGKGHVRRLKGTTRVPAEVRRESRHVSSVSWVCVSTSHDTQEPINAEERIAVFSMVNRRVKDTEELLRAVRGQVEGRD